MTEQEKEIQTIKERNITIKLSDADVFRLAEMAGKHNLKISDILENFIGDLINGTYTNGSDEVMLANQYFDRTWMSHPTEFSFISYLANWDELNSFIEIIEEIEEFKNDIAIFEKLQDKEDIEIAKNEIEIRHEAIEEHYQDYCRKAGEQAQEKEAAMQGFFEWYVQYKALEGGK